jgi:plastocyanin
MKHQSLLRALAIAGAFIALPAAADTVTATLHFENMLPFTGLVYAPDPTDNVMQRGVLDQHDKQFSSPVVAVSPGAELKIKNSDDFEHNVYADDHKQTGIAFDLGRIEPHEDFRLPVRWQEDSLLRLGCKIHPKMKAYVANVRSHYLAPVEFMPGKFDYQVSLSQVPERLKQINVLLPDLAPLTVSLKAGETKSVPVAVNGRSVGTIQFTRKGE